MYNNIFSQMNNFLFKKLLRSVNGKNKNKNEPTKQNIISITVLLSIGRAVFFLTLKC